MSTIQPTGIIKYLLWPSISKIIHDYIKGHSLVGFGVQWQVIVGYKRNIVEFIELCNFSGFGKWQILIVDKMTG
jgi:hypothetical protein